MLGGVQRRQFAARVESPRVVLEEAATEACASDLLTTVRDVIREALRVTDGEWLSLKPEPGPDPDLTPAL